MYNSILAYKRNVFHFSFSFFSCMSFIKKFIQPELNLCLTILQITWGKMIGGVVCLGWNCYPSSLFCHIMACGEMHLSYLAILTSHIVGASNGQIPNCNGFLYHHIYHGMNLSAVKKLSTLGHYNVGPCQFVILFMKSSIWLQTLNTRAMVKHCW